ncbi:translation initiation factor SUI1 [Natronococcus amylolyticus DSM 10524]|uniref:Protein translation factor SUI1 homolog n=1 Tax=Natronococcus amylolyticus DSM 10524 TaxID=1227497 RepID=L9WVX4_9EURY|nr:translation initiation factor SUI1 [Natronococcus amylolyticus DSM 10524]
MLGELLSNAERPRAVGGRTLVDLAKAQQQVSIDVEERRYGKAVTTVSGFDVPESTTESLASSLKSSLATGGTVDDDTIELQGDHRDRLPELLQEHGYDSVS